MIERFKWWKVALLVTAIVVAAQITVSVSARTTRVHQFLTARLEKAFGRPVHVEHFSIEILPSPRIYANGVTVGESPAFGYEYFLRAEHLTAGLRGAALLRGRFELGALSLGQPSLTLVRNFEGRWNLEDWLPQVNSRVDPASRVYGPAAAPNIPNRLQKIEFDDGRINFKSADLKAPFALTGVSGNVEQISTGRWRLQLAAQPWRSGVALQSAGTLAVRGDVAGTSVRLRPASFSVRWDNVSIADLFRLLYAQDFGVRGTFTLEATAKSGGPPDDSDRESPAKTPVPPQIKNPSSPANADPDGTGVSDWAFSLKARATQIHRWDLTERSDNPKLTAKLQGRWNPSIGKITAENMLVETPLSNLWGTAEFGSAASPFMNVNVASAGIQASEILSWYRAFHPGLAEGVVANEFFTGSMVLEGWPLRIQNLNLSSLGGLVNFPGSDQTISVAPTPFA